MVGKSRAAQAASAYAISAYAISLMEELKAKYGGYPVDVALTFYPTKALFHQFRPGEDFEVATAARAKIVAWCKSKNIPVCDHHVTEASPQDVLGRALEAGMSCYPTKASRPA